MEEAFEYDEFNLTEAAQAAAQDWQDLILNWPAEGVYLDAGSDEFAMVQALAEAAVTYGMVIGRINALAQAVA